MKKKLFITACIALLLIANGLNAQSVIARSNDGKKVVLLKDSVALVKSFSGKYLEGKTYMNLEVTNQHSNGLYIIYKSYDGRNFKILKYNKGTGVPISTPIAYSFQDATPGEGIVYYKIMHFGNNKTFLETGIIAIKIEQESLSLEKNDRNKTEMALNKID